jgi:phosphate uptake regulator
LSAQIESQKITSEEKAKAAPSRGETRRVQLTGGGTLVVSLPSNWAKSVGLGPKDEVYLVPQADLSLLVMPEVSEKKKPADSTIDIPPRVDEDEILRQFIAYYIAGFDVVSLKFRAHLPEIRSKLKAHIRDKLIGVEIVEETSDSILAQCLHGHVDLPLKKALDRMAILASSMQYDAVQSLATGNVLLAREIVERDNEVDRFSHFIARQLNLAVHNRVMIQDIGLATAQDCMSYRLIVKSLERIADHAAQIANSTIQMEKKKTPQPLIDHLLRLSKLTSEVYESALRSVHNKSSKTANETIAKLKQVLREEESATEELISSRLDNKSVVSLRLALESMRRIAEYSTDISEIVVNMTVGSPL